MKLEVWKEIDAQEFKGLAYERSYVDDFVSYLKFNENYYVKIGYETVGYLIFPIDAFIGLLIAFFAGMPIPKATAYYCKTRRMHRLTPDAYIADTFEYLSIFKPNQYTGITISEPGVARLLPLLKELVDDGERLGSFN